MKKSIKQFLIYFIIGSVLTFAYKIYNTYVTVSEEVDESIWSKLGCPYDIKEEYLNSNTYRYYRELLVKRGFDDDTNIISNYFKNKQLENLEVIKKKVPEDDALLDEVWFWYKYEPRLLEKNKTITVSEFIDLEAIVKNLSTKTSQSLGFQKWNKDLNISRIINYLIKPNNLAYIDRYLAHSMQTLTEFICKVPNKTSVYANSIDYKLAYFASKMNCLSIYTGRFNESKEISCNSKLITKIFRIMEDIDQSLNQEEIKRIRTVDPQELKDYENLVNGYQKWWTKHCPNEKPIHIDF